jgi:hypothetical protein
MTLSEMHINRQVWHEREHFRYGKWYYYHEHAHQPTTGTNNEYRLKWWHLYVEAREKRVWYDHEISRHTPHPVGEGLTTFDGKPTANWIIPVLRYYRGHGWWTGYVYSGYRSPASQWIAATNYARQLGRSLYEVYPNGPLASNHVGYVWPRGAVDVTNYYQLANAIANHPYPGNHPLRWAGNTIGDLVHFSSNAH